MVMDGDDTPLAKIIPLTREVSRRGRGSLCDELITDKGWDAADINTDIARDFGLEP
jgi:hypothetical protein